MSFLLPTVDHTGEQACFLEPDQLTPELICTMGLCDKPNMPIYALWGGGERCVDLLLSAIADEAANRSLDCFSCRSPSSPHLRRALWVEGVGLLGAVTVTLPRACKLIDLSPLEAERSDEEGEKLTELSAREGALISECAHPGRAAASIGRASLALVAPLHKSEALAQKAHRIAASQPIGSGRAIRLPISVITAKGERARVFPFGEEVQIVGLRELYGVGAHFLCLLADALTERTVDHLILTDGWSGEIVGIWLPASRICYLSDPPERRQKLMTLSRYLLPRPQSVRERYRTLESCREVLCRHSAYLAEEIDELGLQIGAIEEAVLQKSRLGDFRKRLLIELFCR